jgi:hypothetical protein
MAVLFDGVENLAGKSLPNVKIDNISLSIAKDPEPESNPHINSSREITKTGISKNKQIQKTNGLSSTKDLYNKNFYLDITLSIVDVETSGQSSILNQINYMDYVYVKVIQSLSKNLTDELSTKNFPVDYTTLKNVSDYTEKIFKLSDFYNNKVLFLENTTTKTKFYKHIKQVRFTSKNPVKEYLDVFAYSYVDMDELINSFQLSMKSDYEIKGYVSKENVIAEKKTITDSFLLVDQTNNIFIGTPIKGANGKFLKQKASGSAMTNEPLNVVKITNKKIIDGRDIQELERQTKINIEKPNSKKITAEITKNNFQYKTSYLSELYTSKQSSNTYSSFFIFDMVSYLKKQSQTPEIYDNEKIYDYIKIKKLNLIRKRVKTIDSIVQSFDEYTPNKTIISTSENSYNNLTTKYSFYDQYNNLYTTSLDELKNGNFGSSLPTTTTFTDLRKVAAISQLEIPNAKTFRCFTFTDFEMSGLTTGEYQYEVEFEIEDQSIEYYKNILSTLNSLKAKLLNYLSDAERTDMFSATESKQNKKFSNSQKRKYNGLNINSVINAGTIDQKLTIQNAPWIEVPSTLISIEKQLSLGSISITDISKTTQKYYTLLNPTTTNPANISSVVQGIDNMASQIEKQYMISDETQNKNTNNYNRGNKIKTHTLSSTFNKTIDADDRKVGLDYLKPQEPDISTLTFGLARISKQSFQDRTNNEIKKYFPTTTNLNLSNLSSSFSIEDQTSLGDILSYSTSYFSPSAAIIDKETVPIILESTDSSNLNLDMYDNIVNTTLLSTGAKKATKNLSSQVSSRTKLGFSITKNIASNIASTIQLSFITKPDLFPLASNIFDNGGFNTTDRPYTIEEICELSNIEKKDEDTVSSFSSLINLLLDDEIRPSAIEDTTTNLVSITPLRDFNILSANSCFSKAKKHMNAKISMEKSDNVVVDTAKVAPNTLELSGLNAIPLQTKSLMLDSAVKTKFNLSSFEFDTFSHPSTKNFMRLNFQNICKVEYLTGFKIVNGKYDINKPVWKTLTKKDFDSLTGIVVVRTKQYSNKLFNIGTETGLQNTILNEFSLLDTQETSQQNTTTQSSKSTNMLLPNINLNINNVNVNTNVLLNNLKIGKSNDEIQLQLSKELIILNTMELDAHSSYTFSSLELNNVNK